jgi:uncharacterized OB-fold protein
MELHNVMNAEPNSPMFPILPRTDYPPLAGFWEATSREALAFPFCSSCGTWQWYPGWQCSTCGGPLPWKEVRPAGRIHAATLVTHAFHAAFAPLVPIPVAIFEPEDAPTVRLVVRLDGSAELPAPNAPADIAFVRVNDEVSIPVVSVSG